MLLNMVSGTFLSQCQHILEGKGVCFFFLVPEVSFYYKTHPIYSFVLEWEVLISFPSARSTGGQQIPQYFLVVSTAGFLENLYRTRCAYIDVNK